MNVMRHYTSQNNSCDTKSHNEKWLAWLSQTIYWTVKTEFAAWLYRSGFGRPQPKQPPDKSVLTHPGHGLTITCATIGRACAFEPACHCALAVRSRPGSCEVEHIGSRPCSAVTISRFQELLFQSAFQIDFNSSNMQAKQVDPFQAPPHMKLTLGKNAARRIALHCVAM